jgi:hypothetical protein
MGPLPSALGLLVFFHPLFRLGRQPSGILQTGSFLIYVANIVNIQFNEILKICHPGYEPATGPGAGQVFLFFLMLQCEKRSLY